MKNWFRYILCITVVALASTACSHTGFDEQPTPESNEFVEVVFSTSFDTTRSMGDAEHIDTLLVDVSLEDSAPTRYTYSVTNGTVEEFSLKLINGQNYNIVFWAQCSSCTAYDTADLANITISYTSDDTLADVDKRDAFFDAFSFTATRQTARQRASLTRPFALLLAGSENYDSSVANQRTNITISNIATAFNAYTGKAYQPSSASIDYTIDGTTVPDRGGYTMLGCAYLLPANEEPVDIVITTSAVSSKRTPVTFDKLQTNERYFILGTDLISY